MGLPVNEPLIWPLNDVTTLRILDWSKRELTGSEGSGEVYTYFGERLSAEVRHERGISTGQTRSVRVRVWPVGQIEKGKGNTFTGTYATALGEAFDWAERTAMEWDYLQHESDES